MAAPVLQNYGPGNVDELLTTTLVNMRPGIRDNFFRSNPLFKYFYKGDGNKVKIKGGAAYSHGILYDKNSTVDSYQRYDTIDTTPQDGLTRDQWNWAQYAGTISIDGFLERVANQGDSKIEDIMSAKRMQLEESFNQRLEIDMFKATPGAKDIRSLATIIDSTGTEGSINGTTSSWWSSTVNSSVGSFAAGGVAALRTAFNTIKMLNPMGNPELIMSDQTTFEYYEASLVPHERFTDTKLADIGIENLKFKSTPWTFSPQATSGTVYLLHSAGIEFVVNESTDFLVTPFVTPANQDAKTGKMLLACILASGNRRKLGKLSGITA